MSKSTLTDKVVSRYPRKENGRTYLGTGVASVLIALIVLVIACFAALTYLAADSKMELAEKSRSYCDNYYAAETTAVELLDGLVAGSAKPVSTKGDRSTYDTDSGRVVVKQVKDHVTFAVPVGKKQELNVEAVLNKKDVQIQVWAVE